MGGGWRRDDEKIWSGRGRSEVRSEGGLHDSAVIFSMGAKNSKIKEVSIQSPSWPFDRGIQRKERARTRGEAFDDESDLIFSPSSFTDTSRSLRNRISLKF